MKTVSFEVAKAIKEAGYPQYKHYDKYVTEPCKGRYKWHTINSNRTSKEKENDLYDFEVGEYTVQGIYDIPMTHAAVAPTYMEVWLWLYEEKKMTISITHNENEKWSLCGLFSSIGEDYSNPEEAIIAAIEYLAENDLIK